VQTATKAEHFKRGRFQV